MVDTCFDYMYTKLGASIYNRNNDIVAYLRGPKTARATEFCYLFCSILFLDFEDVVPRVRVYDISSCVVWYVRYSIALSIWSEI